MQNKLENGLINIKSSEDVKTTADRLEEVLRAKEMVIFARVNHAAAAQKIGKELRDTELIIFGNPQVGTVLIQASQTTAIDLPMKMLISADQNGQVWISFNDPNYLAQRHNIKDCDDVLLKIREALNNFAHKAISK